MADASRSSSSRRPTTAEPSTDDGGQNYRACRGGKLPPSRDCIWPVPGCALSHIRAADYVRENGYRTHVPGSPAGDPDSFRSQTLAGRARGKAGGSESDGFYPLPCCHVIPCPCPHPHMATAMLLLDDLEARPVNRRPRRMLDADPPGSCCRCSPTVAPRPTNVMSWHRMLASCWMLDSVTREPRLLRSRQRGTCQPGKGLAFFWMGTTRED